MIREALESAYKKTIGALKDRLVEYVSSITKRAGLLQLLYVLFIVALAAGFINAVVFPVPNQSYIPYPGGSAETVPEAVIDSFVIIVGGAGIYLAVLSGRQTVKTRTVSLYLGLALLLIIVSLFTGIDLAILKGYG
jgi:predicted ABC-type sugar transport system permease subunit